MTPLTTLTSTNIIIKNFERLGIFFGNITVSLPADVKNPLSIFVFLEDFIDFLRVITLWIKTV
jgi:hypothetical protein